MTGTFVFEGGPSPVTVDPLAFPLPPLPLPSLVP